MLARVFYAPADWLAHSVSVRTRRAVNFWLLVVWLVPGTALWLYWRHALWFVGFMSLYALWSNHYVGVGAETPVEAQED